MTWHCTRTCQHGVTRNHFSAPKAYDHLRSGPAVVARLNAQRGRRLVIFEPPKDDASKARRKRKDFSVDLLSRAVPARNTADGVRALNKDKPIDPQQVRRYLHGKFEDEYDAA